jgi:YfiH family protein
MNRLILEKLVSPNFPEISHGFFGRRGGVSSGVYDSLNCGLHSGDDLDCVQENRKRVVDSLQGNSLYTVKQVHSNICISIDTPHVVTDDIEADALVTTCAGVVIAAQSADCGPVLFIGETPRGPVIGAAHAGWGGALQGVLESTVEAMLDKGADLASLRAGIGPCIGPESYEVSEGFEIPFLSEDPKSAEFFSVAASNQLRFDLPAYLEFRLRRAGVRHVVLSKRDTYTDEEGYFSFRRQTHRGGSLYGRQLSALAIRGS